METTENVRIALLDAYDNVICFLDNSALDALHYYDDTLTEYLQGSAYTWTAKIIKNNNFINNVVVGNRIAFIYKEHQYYMTIMSIEYSDSSYLSIECQSGALELLNEYSPEIDSSETANTFAYYFNLSRGGANALRLNINQIPDKKLALQFSSYENVLSRLYSLAEDFDAEIEIVPVLNDNYGLKELTCNVYSDGTGGNSGIGQKRYNEIIHLNNNVDPIEKKIDISEMYTAIIPYGKDGLTIESLNGRKVYDDDGITVLYWVNGQVLRAPQAAKDYPSSTVVTDDQYTLMREEYSDCETVESLYANALADLKTHSHPTITYTVNEYVEGDIGDTLTMEAGDELFRARISERTVSFTDPTQNKTTFDDESMMTVSSKISDRATIELVRNKANNKTVVCSAAASNGTVFKNGEGETTLTAQVYENGVNIIQNGSTVEDTYHINWYNSADDSLIRADSLTLTIKATDLVDNKLGVYFKVGRYKTGTTDLSFLKGTYYVSLTNLDEPVLVNIYSANGNMFKNSDVSTTMVVNVTVSGEVIDNSTRLYEVLGRNAKISWKYRMMGDETTSDIPADDPRLSDNGFVFVVSPSDVDIKCTYYCELDF